MDDLLPVTQEDRRTAIYICRQTGWQGVADRLERGWEPEAGTNEANLLEALARHRSSPPLPSDRMVEAVAMAIARFLDDNRQFVTSDCRDIARAALSALSDDEGVG